MSPASATSRLLALLVDALVLLAAGLVGWALLDSQVLAAMTAVEALAVLTLVRVVTGRSPGALATRTAMVRAGTQAAPRARPDTAPPRVSTASPSAARTGRHAASAGARTAKTYPAAGTYRKTKTRGEAKTRGKTRREA